jgi:hypothetical protein
VGILLTVYFAWFARTTLWAHLPPDELMNIHYYWSLPRWQQVLGPLMVWSPLYRPMAAWFLLPVLAGFGLNPAAFRVEMLALLLATVFLMYRLSLLLRSGERAAFLTALIACYHVGINGIYYQTQFIYDVLCGFFFVAALLYYVSIRDRGRIPGWKQVTIFLGLMLAALDSKEMALTLPAVLLFYECFYHAPVPLWRPQLLGKWLRGPGRSVAAGACLNLVFLYGRIAAKDGLIHVPGYGPKLSMARVWDFQIHAFADLFQKWEYFGRAGVVALWIAMFCLAWRRPRPVLRFSCMFLLVAPLPIEFLIGRSGACLYIPMLAWALFVTVVFVDIADGLAGFLAGEPGLRRVGRAGISAVLVIAALVYWVHRNADLKKDYADPGAADISPMTWDAIQQMKAFPLHVRPRSTMVFLNDPFGTWDMLFIADLVFRERTLTVRLARKTPMTSEEIAKADYVFDYRDGRLVQVR